jgi:hypothetical protein
LLLLSLSSAGRRLKDAVLICVVAFVDAGTFRGKAPGVAYRRLFPFHLPCFIEVPAGMSIEFREKRRGEWERLKESESKEGG